jgi:hypothetical protein
MAAVDTLGSRTRPRGPPSLPAFDVGGVDPQVRPLALYRAVQEGLYPLIVRREIDPRSISIPPYLRTAC